MGGKTCAERLALTQKSLEERKKELVEAHRLLADSQSKLTETTATLGETRESLRLEVENGTRLARELVSVEETLRQTIESLSALANERQELATSPDTRWIVAVFPLLFPPWVRQLVAILVFVALASGCACHSNWFRSCGPAYQDWGVDHRIVGGQMVVTVERLPPGQYEVLAIRNGANGEEILARGTIAVSRWPSTRVEVTLEPMNGEAMPKDAFVVVRRLDRIAKNSHCNGASPSGKATALEAGIEGSNPSAPAILK